MRSTLLHVAELLVVWTVLSIAAFHFAVAASRILRRLQKGTPQERDIIEETGEVFEPRASEQDDAIERLWASVHDSAAFESQLSPSGC